MGGATLLLLLAPLGASEAEAPEWVVYTGTTTSVGYTGAALRRDRYSGSVTVQGYGGTAEGGEE